VCPRASWRTPPTATRSVPGCGASSSPTAHATTAGRWAEALVHVETHRGVGQRMLDGRQVAVLAALTSGKSLEASSLLAHTAPGEAWEAAVTDYLTVLNYRMSRGPWRRALPELLTTYLERPDQDDMAVFDTRLGLAVLDMVDSPKDPAARLVVTELHRRTMKTTDGYAARETLSHPLFTALATNREVEDCRALLRACSLEAGALPNEQGDQLTSALRTSDRVIRRSVSPDRVKLRHEPIRPACLTCLLGTTATEATQRPISSRSVHLRK
jgi:hypothetical protein